MGRAGEYKMVRAGVLILVKIDHVHVYLGVLRGGHDPLHVTISLGTSNRAISEVGSIVCQSNMCGLPRKYVWPKFDLDYVDVIRWIAYPVPSLASTNRQYDVQQMKSQ